MTARSFPVADAEDRWQELAPGASPLEALAHRSNLLGADRAVANFGGGNTSVKALEVDPAGNEVEALWVKGSGSDLATIEASGFTGVRLAEIEPLFAREAMRDEDMVAHLAGCQLEPAMPRGSIETLLHAFVPAPHVDHTHPDAINAIIVVQRAAAAIDRFVSLTDEEAFGVEYWPLELYKLSLAAEAGELAGPPR